MHVSIIYQDNKMFETFLISIQQSLSIDHENTWLTMIYQNIIATVDNKKETIIMKHRKRDETKYCNHILDLTSRTLDVKRDLATHGDDRK